MGFWGLVPLVPPPFPSLLFCSSFSGPTWVFLLFLPCVVPPGPRSRGKCGDAHTMLFCVLRPSSFSLPGSASLFLSVFSFSLSFSLCLSLSLACFLVTRVKEPPVQILVIVFFRVFPHESPDSRDSFQGSHSGSGSERCSENCFRIAQVVRCHSENGILHPRFSF